MYFMDMVSEGHLIANRQAGRCNNNHLLVVHKFSFHNTTYRLLIQALIVPGYYGARILCAFGRCGLWVVATA
jgi:hypothetical protein